MRRATLVTAIVCLMVAASGASADIVQGIAIDFVTIGNPGNPGDTRPEADPTVCGSVGYVYRIGKYEVTNAQWYDFVTAAGAPTGNPSEAYDESAYWTGNYKPANCVSWYEAAQFCNYLTSGDKSQGAYRFSGNNSNPGDFEGIDRDSAVSTYGIVYVIPTEDEWYKAAYYTESGYSTYANGTDSAPIAGVDTNYLATTGAPWDVGGGTVEQNGTFDIMGNVWEWNETWLLGLGRGVRGGSRWSLKPEQLGSSFRVAYGPPDHDSHLLGFRIAEIPEPTTLLLLGLGGLMVRRHRQA